MIKEKYNIIGEKIHNMTYEEKDNKLREMLEDEHLIVFPD